MVVMANSADVLDEMKKKSLDVVAIQHQDDFMLVWVVNKYGEMSFIQLNSK